MSDLDQFPNCWFSHAVAQFSPKVCPGKMFTWVFFFFLFKAHFGCHDIPYVGKKSQTWRRHPNLTIAVDWDVKQQISRRGLTHGYLKFHLSLPKHLKSDINAWKVRNSGSEGSLRIPDARV